MVCPNKTKDGGIPSTAHNSSLSPFSRCLPPPSKVSVTGVGHGAAGELVTETEKTTPRGWPEISHAVRRRNPFGIVVAIALSHLSSSQSVTGSVRLVAVRAVTLFVVVGVASSTKVARVGERFCDFDDRDVATAGEGEIRHDLDTKVIAFHVAVLIPAPSPSLFTAELRRTSETDGQGGEDRGETNTPVRPPTSFSTTRSSSSMSARLPPFHQPRRRIPKLKYSWSQNLLNDPKSKNDDISSIVSFQL
ncbi:hypothetical protein TIFTF001_030033 [Ficus carica]|uniref:Uncharacterized protein n=1 Tax=Ficus carica TaxID=3494 RepID=A0AA88DSN4_FICCA|nr:hypothetical protein TIFTF001_030033 [Ficus carica]